jgi:DHA1 family bicyclomycin/chloramphenicol resistance-like MFS transporter
MLGALMAGVIAPWLSASPLWLACGQLACVLAGGTMWLGTRSRIRH